MARAWAMVALLAVAASSASDRGRLHSPRATTPPEIDGKIEPLEWRSAEPTTLLSRDARCVVYVLNDDKNIFWALAALDDATNTTGRTPGVFDNVAIWFAGEFGYWLYGDGIDAKNQKSSPFPSSADGAVAGPPRAPRMTYELVVPLGEIGIEAGESVRVGLHYWDDYDHGPSFWWPGGVDVFTPSSFGTLITSRKP